MRSRLGIQLLAGTVVLTLSLHAEPQQLPARLDDGEYWRLIQALSEPDRPFVPGIRVSDNLVSNEFGIQKVIPQLTSRIAAAGVYVGVGPEQNFTYIAALKPAVAFIVDIRRGNRDLHLLYKALFALSADRAEFVARLFGRPRPPGLTTGASVEALLSAYDGVDPIEAVHATTVAQVRAHLLDTRGFSLTDDEVQAIAAIHRAFVTSGPAMHYWSGTDVEPFPHLPSYADLMRDTDGSGATRSFLASEDRFRVVKELHGRNLILPIVGDFAGPTALRALGRWVAARGRTISAFYLSNVDHFLRRALRWDGFCTNLRALPLDRASTFIRLGSLRDERGRQVISYGRDPSGTAMLQWSDGTRGVLSDEEFKTAFRNLSTSELGSLLDLSQSCR